MQFVQSSDWRRSLIALSLVVLLLLGVMIFVAAPKAEACGCGEDDHWWPPTAASHTFIRDYDSHGGHYHQWLHSGPGGIGTYHELCGCENNCPTGPIGDPLE